MSQPGLWFDKLTNLLARLRGPDGCPWDREQTLRSLRPYILEEAYELVDAIDRMPSETADDGVREELGDLLLEVVFVAQIAREQGAFQPEDFIQQIHEKLVRRHPHVFGDKKERGPVETAGGALKRWDEIKAEEKKNQSSRLDGVAKALPSLVRAQKLSKRAADTGFDWPEAKAVREKVTEELRELDEAARNGDREHTLEEFGDLLFALVNLARHFDIDAELALAAANRKFTRRFQSMEDSLKRQDRDIEQANLDELEILWLEAKRKLD